jgi:hypothetical protein
VTHRENILRAFRSRTVCKHGHPFHERNTYYTPQGHRKCRRCRAIGMAKKNARVR